MWIGNSQSTNVPNKIRHVLWLVHLVCCRCLSHSSCKSINLPVVLYRVLYSSASGDLDSILYTKALAILLYSFANLWHRNECQEWPTAADLVPLEQGVRDENQWNISVLEWRITSIHVLHMLHAQVMTMIYTVLYSVLRNAMNGCGYGCSYWEVPRRSNGSLCWIPPVSTVSGSPRQTIHTAKWKLRRRRSCHLRCKWIELVSL